MAPKPCSQRTDQGAPVADLRAMPRDLAPLDASAGTDWRKDAARLPAEPDAIWCPAWGDYNCPVENCVECEDIRAQRRGE